MLIPEILAPGGSFNSSIHAFEAGADAVYIGMSSFSARKGAKNFTLDSLRRLKNYAEKHQKKIFIAINTVLKDDELPQVITLLHHLSLIEVDAIILQDTGLAYIIKNHFPHLEMHASTQLAAHNSEGVQILKEEGFSRIILARELTLEEIGKIRTDHRDIELEVFIHGAMCFSFSGICLASGTLLGRSGNRGECGQICRSWFDQKNYSFSANDLKAGTAVKDLQNLGINSLKIEGRLKSPEYVSHTVSYYRSILEEEKPSVIQQEEELSSLSFSRDQTSAFFKSAKGENMVNRDYASHTGIPAGKVLSSDKGGFRFKTETDVSDRDGLLLFRDREKYQFALRSTGKRNSYKKGETVEVLFKSKVEKGDSIFKVSGHNLQLKEFKKESYKLWKTGIPATVRLTGSGILLSSVLNGHTIEIEEKTAPQKSTGGKSFQKILEENLIKSGTAIFSIRNVHLENDSELNDDEIFFPLSILKKLKNTFYEKLEDSLDTLFSDSSTKILQSIEEKLKSKTYYKGEFEIPERKDMNPEGGLIPFVGKNRGFSESTVYYPLPPLIFHKEDFMELEKAIKTICSDRSRTIIVGINNISHVYFVQKFSKFKNVVFFTDYCTYIANRANQLFYREKIEKLLFSYFWIESKSEPLRDLKKIEPDFNPHLFVSRICYKLHNELGTCGNCSKDLTYKLMQRDKEFTIRVKDCITWLFQN